MDSDLTFQILKNPSFKKRCSSCIYFKDHFFTGYECTKEMKTTLTHIEECIGVKYKYWKWDGKTI